MKKPYQTIIFVLAVVLIGISGWLLYRQFVPGRMPAIRVPGCKEIYDIDERISEFELASAYDCVLKPEEISEVCQAEPIIIETIRATIDTNVSEKENAPASLSGPPYSLAFDSIKEYQDFFFVSDLDDADFMKYLRKRSFDMNGIRNKEDLAALISKLLPVPFPIVTDACLTNVEILPEHDQLFLRYEYGPDVSTFRIDYTDMPQIENAFAVEENLQLWNEAVFDDYSYDEKQQVHVFQEEINGCTVLYRYFGSEAEAYATIEKFTTFISAVKPLKENSDLIKDGSADLPIKEPDCISFQTIEMYWGFFLSADQSNERFMMYLEKNEYDRNGIRSKEDFFALTAKLMSVPFPVVEGANLTYAEILPEYKQINLQYILQSGDVCTFLIDYSGMFLTEQILELEENLKSWDENVFDDYAYFVRQHAGKVLEETIQPWNEIVFDDYSYDEKQNAHQLVEEFNGCSVLCTYFGSEVDAHIIMEEYTNFISAAGFSNK